MRPGSVVALSFALAVSMSANVSWAARDDDPVTIVAGVVTPVLLVLAVHQWRAQLDAEGWRRTLRLAAMASVTAVSAAWSWTHTTRLLLAHSIETPLAVAAPLAVDGLAVMATMALWPAVSSSVYPLAASRDEVPPGFVSLRDEVAERRELPYAAMNRLQLREACGARRLSQQGTTADMRARLVSDDADTADTADEPIPAAAGDVDR